MIKTAEIWRQAVLTNKDNVRKAISNLNSVSFKIVLVVNELGILEGTISDGDIRRALLKGANLDSPLSFIVNRNPFVVSPEIGRDIIIQLMVANKIKQIPIVDADNHLIGLHTFDEINLPERRSNLMVIMAGGRGVRLGEFTKNCPKPLLPVAGKPMLEHIIDRAKNEGFDNFVISIGYLGHMIEDYFGAGEKLDVQIEYLREDHPLGTAGALSLLKPFPEAPFIVTNGDVISDIRYGELLDFHIQYKAAATMAVSVYEWQQPFGVVQTNGVEIIGFEEKPIYRCHVNAGVYALNPTALNSLSNGDHCDMPSLFQRLQAKMEYTVAYPMHESWLDVGRPNDLIAANKT